MRGFGTLGTQYIRILRTLWARALYRSCNRIVEGPFEKYQICPQTPSYFNPCTRAGLGAL